ncbi:Hypothetical protein A7982_08547 [Minicystis rosea]|nr:Hypothetical protein A7982_08547 [Minicystis rosea]
MLVVGTAGCGGMSKAELEASRSPVPPDLSAQAATDLHCPQASVTVEGLELAMARVSGGLPTHRATGCGHEALYTCAHPCHLMAVRPLNAPVEAPPARSSR